jgi:hypothetical protein
MQTSQCLSYRSLQERREGLEAFQTSLQRRSRRRMRRRRRRMMMISRRWRGSGGIVRDSLVVEEGIMVKFPSIPFAMCLLHLKLLLQGSFRQNNRNPCGKNF